MNGNEYQRLAVRTEASVAATMSRLSRDGETKLRLIHAALGLQSEAGELADTLKKHLFYGAPLDRLNLKEELGDLLWYVALACNALCVDISEVMAANIAKLRAHYPDKYDAEGRAMVAAVRDAEMIDTDLQEGE